MSNIFISYDRGSQSLVEVLANDIKDLGHTVWYDQELSGGQSWWDQILENIRGCDIFVFALAPKALESIPCNREYEYAFTLGKPIIPILISGGVSLNLLPEALSQIQCIDFRDPNEKTEAANDLSKAIRILQSHNSLPSPLPAPPEAPPSFIGTLAQRTRAPVLTNKEQWALLYDLRKCLNEKKTENEALLLLRRLMHRKDLTASNFELVNELLKTDEMKESSNVAGRELRILDEAEDREKCDAHATSNVSTKEKNKYLLLLNHAINKESRFPYDVFISYATIENKSISMRESDGWIDRFHIELAMHLGRRLGREPIIWRDDRIRNANQFDTEIVPIFSMTACMISIITPTFLESNWCIGEVMEFQKASEKSAISLIDEDFVSGAGILERIMRIDKIPLKPSENIRLPDVLRRQVEDDYSSFGTVLENEERENERKQRIGSNLLDLSDSIAKVIHRLNSQEGPPQKKLICFDSRKQDQVDLGRSTLDLRKYFRRAGWEPSVLIKEGGDHYQDQESRSDYMIYETNIEHILNSSGIVIFYSSGDREWVLARETELIGILGSKRPNTSVPICIIVAGQPTDAKTEFVNMNKPNVINWLEGAPERSIWDVIKNMQLENI